MASLALPCSVAGAASTPVVTNAQAMQIVNTWATTSNTSSVAANNTVEGPPLSDADNPAIQSGPPPTGPAVAPSSVTAYVPQQTGYPAVFLAHAVFTDGSDTYLVFAKRSKTSPWLAVYQMNAISATSVPQPLVDSSGSAAVVVGSSGLKFAPTSLGRSVVAFLQQAAQTKSAPSSKIFDASVAQVPLIQIAADAKAGAVDTLHFSAASYPTYSFRTSNGGALTFVAVRGAFHSVPNTINNGALVITTPEAGLTVGTHYASINGTILGLAALVVPPANSGGAVSLAGFYYNVTSAHGVKAPSAR